MEVEAAALELPQLGTKRNNNVTLSRVAGRLPVPQSMQLTWLGTGAGLLWSTLIVWDVFFTVSFNVVVAERASGVARGLIDFLSSVLTAAAFTAPTDKNRVAVHLKEETITSASAETASSPGTGKDNPHSAGAHQKQANQLTAGCFSWLTLAKLATSWTLLASYRYQL